MLADESQCLKIKKKNISNGIFCRCSVVTLSNARVLSEVASRSCNDNKRHWVIQTIDNNKHGSWLLTPRKVWRKPFFFFFTSRPADGRRTPFFAARHHQTLSRLTASLSIGRVYRYSVVFIRLPTIINTNVCISFVFFLCFVVFLYDGNERKHGKPDVSVQRGCNFFFFWFVCRNKNLTHYVLDAKTAIATRARRLPLNLTDFRD